MQRSRSGGRHGRRVTLRWRGASRGGARLQFRHGRPAVAGRFDVDNVRRGRDSVGHPRHGRFEVFRVHVRLAGSAVLEGFEQHKLVGPVGASRPFKEEVARLGASVAPLCPRRRVWGWRARGVASGRCASRETDRGVSYVHDGHASMAGQRSAREATGQVDQHAPGRVQACRRSPPRHTPCVRRDRCADAPWDGPSCGMLFSTPCPVSHADLQEDTCLRKARNRRRI